MRIAYITSRLPYPPDHGGAVKTLATIQALVREGSTIHLFCFGPQDYEDSIRALKKLGVSSVVCQARVLEYEAAPLFHGIYFLRSILRNTPYTLEKFLDKALKKSVERFCGEYHPEIVWIDHFNLIPYVPQSFTGRTVLEEHNIQSLLFSRLAERERNPLLRAMYSLESSKWERFERMFLPRFSAIAAISNVDRKLLKDTYRLSTVRYLGTAVETAKKRSRPRKQLLFVGRLTWQPNKQGLTWFLDRVWPLFKKQFPEYRLVVIGDYVGKSSSLAGVSFEGSVSDIEPYLLESSALICPIFAGSGVRIKILQAFAHGLPVVSTTLGSEGIPAEDGRSILSGDSADDFSQRLQLLLTDSRLRDRLIREGKRVLSDHYSLSAFQKRVHELLA